jgi:hypothetical protein
MRIVAELPTELVTELKEYAAANGTSMNKLVNGWIKDDINNKRLSWAHTRLKAVNYSKIHLTLTPQNQLFVLENKVQENTSVPSIIHGTVAEHLNWSPYNDD